LLRSSAYISTPPPFQLGKVNLPSSQFITPGTLRLGDANGFISGLLPVPANNNNVFGLDFAVVDAAAVF